MSVIGSVFPDAGGEPTDAADSLWRAWTAGFSHVAAFRTARAGLRALLEQRGVTRLWLPAYVCEVMLQAAPPGCEALFYGHGPGLPLTNLKPEAGDAVLGVDVFGRIDPALAAQAKARPDVLWIEDRAQALAPGPVWGDVALYSPRKLLGVADGGLLVADAPLPQPRIFAGDEPMLWEPHRLRGLDPHGREPSGWGGAFQAREAAFTADPVAMQPRTRALLEQVAITPPVERRRVNAAALHSALPEFTLWSERPADFAPLAAPIRVADAAAAVRALAAEGIFCPRYWPALPSPSDAFPQAHRLARELVSLPCDHRYDAADMARVASAVRRLCRPVSGSR